MAGRRRANVDDLTLRDVARVGVRNGVRFRIEAESIERWMGPWRLWGGLWHRVRRVKCTCGAVGCVMATVVDGPIVEA